jgi:SAM-dependent methyltransferase
MHGFSNAWLRALSKRLPEGVKRPLRWLLGGVRRSYRVRRMVEKEIFSQQTVVHDLPPIFHYWSNKWLRPQLEAFGFSNPDQFFAMYLQRSHDDAVQAGRSARFASLGSGNCDTEVRFALALRDAGCQEFSIECLDLNMAMLERGRELARQHGVAGHLAFTRGDFNRWKPSQCYDAIVANQSLHHVVNLEGLFKTIESALVDDGRFVTSDMIGRNGHRRWPEALALVQEYWRDLPDSHRRNVQLRRYETEFMDWDCSVVGFEGIRSQDILPLLISSFAFEFFFAYGNIIDPFIDRSFGPNFDATQAWDREFIDKVHLRDEKEMFAGRVTPTHVMAVMRRASYHGETVHRAGLAPTQALRGQSEPLAHG